MSSLILNSYFLLLEGLCFYPPFSLIFDFEIDITVSSTTEF